MLITGGKTENVICTGMDQIQLPFSNKKLYIQITVVVYLGLTPEFLLRYFCCLK